MVLEILFFTPMAFINSLYNLNINIQFLMAINCTSEIYLLNKTEFLMFLYDIIMN